MSETSFLHWKNKKLFIIFASECDHAIDAFKVYFIFTALLIVIFILLFEAKLTKSFCKITGISDQFYHKLLEFFQQLNQMNVSLKTFRKQLQRTLSAVFLDQRQFMARKSCQGSFLFAVTKCQLFCKHNPLKKALFLMLIITASNCLSIFALRLFLLMDLHVPEDSVLTNC